MDPEDSELGLSFSYYSLVDWLSVKAMSLAQSCSVLYLTAEHTYLPLYVVPLKRKAVNQKHSP